jgi:predicted nucleotidyltransferase
MIPPSILESVRIVASAFGNLLPEVVFVGGATTGFLVTDPAAPEQRPTQDVDVVLRIASYADYIEMCQRLRELGFVEDSAEGSPRCRWIVRTIKVDVMSWGQHPGPPSRWFEEAHRLATTYSIGAGLDIRVITAPYFLAAKLEAFLDGRRDDIRISRDVEDIIAVVDGRSSLQDEVTSSSALLREYVASQVRALIANLDFVDIVAGHLPGDSASQARLPGVVARLRALADTA